MFQLIQSFNLTPEMTDLLQIIGLLAVASILVYLLTRYIWRRRLRKAQAQYQELEDKHGLLTGEHDELQQKQTTLLLQKKQLADKLAYAKDGSRNLQLEVDNLQPYKVRYETVKINYDRAKEQVAALEEHIRRVEDENEHLKEDVQMQAQKNRELVESSERGDVPGAALTNTKEKLGGMKDRFATMLNKSDVASAIEKESPTQTYDFGADSKTEDATKDMSDIMAQTDDKVSDTVEEIKDEAAEIDEATAKEGSGWAKRFASFFGGGKKEEES